MKKTYRTPQLTPLAPEEAARRLNLSDGTPPLSPFARLLCSKRFANAYLIVGLAAIFVLGLAIAVLAR